MNNSSLIAKELLKIQAIRLSPNEPFVWTSGLKAPIYCDNRLIISFIKVRDFVVDSFIQAIKDNFSDVEVIGATSTAGIPHAAFIAQKLELPMLYVRNAPKKYGKQNQIEGFLKAGQKVLVIEDLISTGKSSLEVCKVLKQAQAEVLGVLAIFTYELKQSEELFNKENITLKTLSSFSALIQIAKDELYINNEEFDLLMKWKQNPLTWQNSALLN